MSVTNSILFISHDATRTGAPILLKHHLRGLKAQYPDIEFDILLRDGGEMSNEFEQITKVLYLPGRSLTTRILNFILKGYNDYEHRVKKVIKKKYKLIYGNTVVTADMLRIAKINAPDIITVCHVHELDIAIKQFSSPEIFRKAIPYIDHFITASNAVTQLLTQSYGISATNIYTHFEHIPLVTELMPVKNLLPAHKGLRICGCGTLDWRKGIDIFVQTAFILNKSQPELDFHFYWIGGKAGSIEHEKTKYDIKRLGIANKLTLVENCTNPLDYINECDIFLLTSREDPFPLVCLEAASLAKPIICFRQSGGMTEFVDDNIGWQIDYLDLNQLTKVLADILNKPARSMILAQKGKAARQKVQQYDIKRGVDKLKVYLDNIMQHKSASIL